MAWFSNQIIIWVDLIAILTPMIWFDLDTNIFRCDLIWFGVHLISAWIVIWFDLIWFVPSLALLPPLFYWMYKTLGWPASKGCVPRLGTNQIKSRLNQVDAKSNQITPKNTGVQIKSNHRRQNRDQIKSDHNLIWKSSHGPQSEPGCNEGQNEGW